MANQKAITRIINAHTHIITLKHVPWGIRILIVLSWPVQAIMRFFRVHNNFIDRAAKLLSIGSKNTQIDIFEIMRSHYPSRTKFVLLSMDMEFMGGGKVSDKYEKQLNELAEIKNASNRQKWAEVAYPFVCVDPRRPGVVDLMKKCIEDYKFQGIKIYPPLGYFPFPFPYKRNGKDIGIEHDPMANEGVLAEIYRYAQAYEIPVLSHCTPGGLRGYKLKYSAHPVTGGKIERTRKSQAYHLSHPRNYTFLLEQYPDLKICLAHFGGHADWKRQLTEPLEPFDSSSISQYGKDQIQAAYELGDFVEPVWNPTAQEVQENTWLNIIRQFLLDGRYPNVYADISYNAFEPYTLAYLKILVEDRKINQHILFGTDFYIIRLHRSEKEFSIGMRGYIGEEKFRLIADQNPKVFLKNKINPL